ncbi:Sir2 family NAD-dependent protein deacetylase [Cellulomonas sp. zg-ZUI222]|uniref:protein acetyllysine N-acetyltransferase n=1 Tax=Cellulomonas wangleii TaxID=2816956 RepID=A0ABX8DC43_9CELL|nr:MULTISPECIES: Sir2 family NAD-dependent protein deacetylase [Cellulomonas]MBO0899172.1 Sir2 family NAD-dependent protein deacetylase [Cellulomonas sp. zg-ZUI22]MBO0920022.1 Sir2 family NAD-dependent protein deacetylase [Cellulomonas wangleii]MBO0923549.1 Sir2 family NAD-dependent protein deacetylase [Cellulomonas wangleii]QVI64346.1 Sir2 family NAD-dependent protein deacetylase [Cellulomonas wangleii]
MPHHADAPTVTVLTGAGISTASGIPDFRGPQGVWTRDPHAADLLELDLYVRDPAVRERGWRMWAEHPAWHAHPTAAHRALVELERAGALLATLTQNFDGLHQAAGADPERVVELHGSLATTSCLRCGTTWPTREVLARLPAEPDPACTVCGGVLKPDVVYFGERLPEDALERAVAAATDAVTFVAIGTTLTVQPVASLAAVAVDAGARLVVVNAEPTPYDHLADEVVRDPIDEAVPALVADLLATR